MSFFNEKNLIIGKNTTAFKYWTNPPAIILRKYYFFDIKNAEEFLIGKQKPILVERGPYVYKQVIIRSTWKDFSKFLSYINKTIALGAA